jgi:ABC-2 type transport system permease protein
MSHVLLIAGRELKAYLRSPLGAVIAAVVLLGEGLWFMAKALGDTGAKRLSANVLATCLEGVSGATILACWVLSMRLIAWESEHGTLVLLRTSPVSDRATVLGKYLSVMGLLVVLTLLSAYMPALIFVNGKVSVGHILVGYLGILMLGSAVTAIGLFGSAVAKNQIIAAIISGALVLVFVLLWLVAKVSEPPIRAFVDGLAIHHLRQRDSLTGVLRLENVVYYAAMTFFFLLAAIKTLEARRWR